MKHVVRSPWRAAGRLLAVPMSWERFDETWRTRVASLRARRLARLVGAVRSAPTLQAPLTGRPCVAWEVTVRDRHDMSEYLHLAAASDFLIVEEGGAPRGAAYRARRGRPGAVGGRAPGAARALRWVIAGTDGGDPLFLSDHPHRAGRRAGSRAR